MSYVVLDMSVVPALVVLETDDAHEASTCAQKYANASQRVVTCGEFTSLALVTPQVFDVNVGQNADHPH